MKLEDLIKEQISNEVKEVLELKLKSLLLKKQRRQIQQQLQREHMHIGSLEHSVIDKIIRRYNRLSPHGKRIVKMKLHIEDIEDREAKIGEELSKKLQGIMKTEKYYEYMKHKETLENALGIKEIL